MTRLKTDELLNPILKFRYFVEFPEYNTTLPYLSGVNIDLPKWTIENGWSNPINIEYYNFEVNPSIVDLLIEISRKPLNNRLKVNILTPDANGIIAQWDIIGNIEVFDFGDMSWAKDDVLMATIKILPIDCKYTNLMKQNGETQE